MFLKVRNPCKSLSYVLGKQKASKGFSFPEILVTLGVIIALASGAVATADNMMRAGRYNATKSTVSAISVAVAEFRYEVDRFPTSLTELTTAVDGKGPWLSADGLQDPWNHTYMYEVTSDSSRFAVWSAGPNGNNDSGTPASAGTFGGDDIGIFGH